MNWKTVILAASAMLAFAMTMERSFAGDPTGENREAVEHELRNLALRAQEHYYRPASRCGGGGAFDNSQGGFGLATITMLTSRPSNAVGVYSIGTVCATSVTLNAEGIYPGDDGCPISITVTVFPDSMFFCYNN